MRERERETLQKGHLVAMCTELLAKPMKIDGEFTH